MPIKPNQKFKAISPKKRGETPLTLESENSVSRFANARADLSTPFAFFRPRSFDI